MTAQQPQKQYSAAFIEPGHGRASTTLILATVFASSVGTNVSAYDHALALPRSTGNPAQDRRIVDAFQQTAQTWERTGQFVDPFQALEAA